MPRKRGSFPPFILNRFSRYERNGFRPVLGLENTNGQVLIDDHWLKVIREDLRFPNGALVKNFYTVERPAYAAVVPLLDDEHVVLVRQYRHGPRKEIINIPMGVLAHNEESMETAQRELQEETSYVAEKITKVGVFENAPSFLRLKCHLFIAQDLSKDEKLIQNQDSSEKTEPIVLSLQDAIGKILAGEIQDMTTVIGILAVRSRHF